jgi:hypothetical protein
MLIVDNTNNFNKGATSNERKTLQHLNYGYNGQTIILARHNNRKL